MTYAVVSDVSTRLGRPISDPLEVAQVQAWLGDVEAEITDRFTRSGLVLGDQVALGDPSMASVIKVEAEAVIRRILRPIPGRTSTTRTIDDGTVTDRWEGPVSHEFLTATDWDVLLPAITSGAFSTRPGFEPDAPTTLTPLDWS